MTESDETRAPSVGQTGGLPGANADPRASELPDDQAKDTIAMADVSTPDVGTGDPDGPRDETEEVR